MVVNLRDPAIVPEPTEEWIDRQPHLFSGYFDEVDGYRRHRRHGNETCLLFYTVSGAGFMRGQGGTLTRAMPGDLHLYRPDVWHDYGTYPGGRWGFHWIQFRPRPGWAEWLRLNPVGDITGLVHAHINSPEVHGRIVEALRRIHRDTAMDTVWRSELAMNAIEYILLLTGDASGLGRRPLDPASNRRSNTSPPSPPTICPSSSWRGSRTCPPRASPTCSRTRPDRLPNASSRRPACGTPRS